MFTQSFCFRVREGKGLFIFEREEFMEREIKDPALSYSKAACRQDVILPAAAR